MQSPRLFNAWRCAGAVAALLSQVAFAQSAGGVDKLAESYRFLTSTRERGGILYRATAGELDGTLLPLSFRDSAEYWALHVCEYPSTRCAVTDRYDPASYKLAPDSGTAGDLQTERVEVHGGTSIYDAATWQIAVVLGEMANRFGNPGEPAWKLAAGVDRQHTLGYGGNAAHFVAGGNRAVTQGAMYRYNGTAIERPQQAFSYRMLARAWLAEDPLAESPFASLIELEGALPADNTAYRKGRISWPDWKPFTGENAWAFLIGPLQASSLHFLRGEGKTNVPYRDAAVQNALGVLPTFATMQSALGAVYYAPMGTVQNQGEQAVDPHEVSVENNASVLAGLRILRATLQAQVRHDDSLAPAERDNIQRALATIGTMIDGGRHADGRITAGLLAFFRDHAWQQGEFVRGGLAAGNDRDGWQPFSDIKAVDANTWAVSALGAMQLEEWFGFGAGFELWRRIKGWGAYGRGEVLWGVGFSDHDGNGIDEQGRYRSGVMSAEWTAGAITMVRELLRYYEELPTTGEHRSGVRHFIAQLQADESAMLRGVQQLRLDTYSRAGFPGTPADFEQLIPQLEAPYLYASRRYLVPFGWYANPLPSTCATAWMIMVANRFDPLQPVVP